MEAPLSVTASGLEAYQRRLFGVEDEVLARVREQHARMGLPSIHVSAEQGRLLQVLVRAVGATRVLELGSLAGYSGVWLARALPPGGSLVTIERDPARAVAARAAFAEAGVTARARVVEGEALAVLSALDGPFDAVFLDADKAPMPSYFHHALRLLRLGGILIADNAFFHGTVADPDDHSPDAEGMREFNRLAAGDPRLVSALVPMRDGIVVAVKVAQ